MQGGDFLYGSAGAPKDEQQPNTIEKKGKKSFQLSKILPSPSKKGSQRVEYCRKFRSFVVENIQNWPSFWTWTLCDMVLCKIFLIQNMNEL